jgi:hypothetical protein
VSEWGKKKVFIVSLGRNRQDRSIAGTVCCNCSEDAQLSVGGWALRVNEILRNLFADCLNAKQFRDFIDYFFLLGKVFAFCRAHMPMKCLDKMAGSSPESIH